MKRTCQRERLAGQRWISLVLWARRVVHDHVEFNGNVALDFVEELGIPGRLDPARLVFIDETWAKTNMTGLCGWAPRDASFWQVPQGHWRTLTFLAALRQDRIDAPWVIDGPINGEPFWPTWSSCLFRRSSPVTSSSSTIPQPQGQAVRRAIRAAGAQLFFLPPTVQTSIRNPQECANYLRNAGYASV